MEKVYRKLIHNYNRKIAMDRGQGSLKYEFLIKKHPRIRSVKTGEKNFPAKPGCCH
jgi:hypothetical protein